MSIANIKALPKDVMAELAMARPRLTGAQLAHVLSNLTGARLADVLPNMTGEQLAHVLPNLTDARLADVLSNLTGEQLAHVLPNLTDARLADVLPNMTGEQLAHVPKVDSLYSRLLADLNSDKRTLDQSSFGEAACKTPMCIAGHTVHLGGDAGYALKRRFGYAVAAGMIHLVSTGGKPMPSYGCYPDEWAMAYIEARAKEEEAALVATAQPKEEVK